LQLFYAGADNGVHSRWRNPDGSWSDEQNLGGQVTSTKITAIAVPGTEILQLFYKGTDNGVWSRWRNPDGSWSDEQNLGGGVSPGGGVNWYSNITASVVPGAEILQLFYVDADGEVFCRWRNPDGSWSGEQDLGGFATSDVTAIALPGTEILQLFYRGAAAPAPPGENSGVCTRWRNPDGSWSTEQSLGGVPTSGITIAVLSP
jgi:hypothetical protein